MPTLDVDVLSIPTAWWDIVAALATLLAALIALYLGLSENKARNKRQADELGRLERERDEARNWREQERREAQAREIGIWTEDANVPREDGEIDEHGNPYMRWGQKVVVHNYSRFPIFAAQIFGETAVGDSPNLTLFKTVFPGEELETNCPPTRIVRYSVRFRDLNSEWWIRSDDGTLVVSDWPER